MVLSCQLYCHMAEGWGLQQIVTQRYCILVGFQTQIQAHVLSRTPHYMTSWWSAASLTSFTAYFLLHQFISFNPIHCKA